MNVDRLVEKCHEALPSDWKQRPWEHLDHGRAVLETEDQLNAYISAYGEMHIAKCRMAMQHFPFEELVYSRNERGEVLRLRNYEVYDWGCGQGLGSLVLTGMLHERDMLHALLRITMIEPSSAALARASQWTRQAVSPSTEIREINRYIPGNGQPAWTDVECESPIAIHICSNILDIREVGLKWLAGQCGATARRNIFICVGPQYKQGVSRIEDFHNYLGAPDCFTDFSAYPCAYTSRTHHPFGIEARCFVHDGSAGLDAAYVEQSGQRYLDEYRSGDECLRGALPEAMISAYHHLSDAAPLGSFELYLRPTIGVERPDFILAGITRGVVIVNLCEDISNFAEDYERVEAIKSALIDTYIKSLKIGTILTPATYNAIKVGLYFTTASTEEVQQACRSYYRQVLDKWEEQENKRKLFCKQKDQQFTPTKAPADGTAYLVRLNAGNCREALKRVSCQGFRYDYFAEIKDEILGRWHSYSQGDATLRLSKRQQELVDNNSERLRIKGVAGCGKTQIVAHKAVREHLRTGRKVLIVTYNISLIRYIRMRINQVPADFSTDAFEIINYHQFFLSKARRYHGSHIPFGAADTPKFFEPYKDEIIQNMDRYDTIIVDEAQDYTTAWFSCLTDYFLASGGRIMLCGDGGQNLYNREVEAASRMPVVRGFGDRWRLISESVTMRQLNPRITILASDFARQFNVASENLKVQDGLNLFDYKMGYWQISSSTNTSTLADNVRWILGQYKLDPKEVAVLGQSINQLRWMDYYLRTKYHCKTITTFESQEENQDVTERTRGTARRELVLRAIRRVAKVHFTTDVDKLKLATIQSFKGWESKSIILIIQPESPCDSEAEEDSITPRELHNIPAHIYTAITRARENLFILNLGNEAFHDFFKDRISNDRI